MGYCTYQRRAKFRILAADKPAALAQVKHLVSQKDKMGGGSWSGGKRMTSCFSWVDMVGLEGSTTLEAALEAWRWEAETSESTGDITTINFMGEKLGDDVTLFEALARYVESGSFIEMQGEDGALWRWCFDNGKFSEKGATISWE